MIRVLVVDDDFMVAKVHSGYVAFAIDMYGKGVRAKDASESAKMAGVFKKDRKLMRERAAAMYEKAEMFDIERTGAVARGRSADGAVLDGRSMFEIGSIAKQFTATAILKLRDEGKLSLDDHLDTLLAESEVVPAVNQLEAGA